METTAPSAAPTALQQEPLAIIENILVPSVAEVAYHLRRSAGAGDASTVQQSAQQGVAALESILTLWAPLLRNFPDVNTHLAECRAQIAELVQMASLPLDELRIAALARYYSLEMIPSQIVAALEQGRIDRREAPSRFQLINQVIALKGAKSYLEIGCCKNDCFNEVQCSQKVGVDPVGGGTLRMKSDEFFAVNAQQFDVIFIDGLHEAWQVDRDIENALRFLSPRGVILMHDCNPLFDIRTVVPRISETWNGDTWKSFVRARSRPEIDCAVGRFDHGCGVIVPRPTSAPLAPIPEERLTWDELSKNRAQWLRLMEFDEIIRWIKG